MFSDDIKNAIAKYLGSSASRANLAKLQEEIKAIAYAYKPTMVEQEIQVILSQSSVYLGLTIMVDSIQNQIDLLNNQITALQTSLAGMTIGTTVQGWDAELQAIANLSLSALQYIGTNNSNQITQYSLQRRLTGEVAHIAYDPATAGWIISTPIYTDPDGWLWYQPNGTGLSNANAKYLNLFTALWGTTVFTISGGKGASAAADWAASKTLIIPDMRGRALASTGTATAGATNRTLGSVWGSETITLAIANMPLHRHNLNLIGVTATGLAGSSGSGHGMLAYGANTITINQGNVAGNRVSANDALGAIADAGSGTSFTPADPTKAYLELWFMNSK